MEMVSYKKYIDKQKPGKSKTEFMLINFDYIDGIDYLAKLFCEMYGMSVEYMPDGIWYRIIRLFSEQDQYELLWHEDVGNSIYMLKEEAAGLARLEARLKDVLHELNRRIQAVNSEE